MKRMCNCSEFVEFCRWLDSATFMMWNHGRAYSGPLFRICPFCGTVLVDVESGVGVSSQNDDAKEAGEGETDISASADSGRC